MTSDLDLIYNCDKEYQLIIAGAGGGKTHTLVNALFNRIHSKRIDPAHHTIIVFTFTNNAADELVVKLSKLLGKEKNVMNKIYVGTIHGWCQEYLSHDSFLANTKVLGELEQLQLIQRIYNQLEIESVYSNGSKFTRIENFLHDLELFYNENLSINDERIPHAVKKILNRYLEFIRAERFVDFGSLIIRANEAFKKDTNTTPVHVFIDEYQDINNAQVELIKTLLSRNNKSTLFAVGDPRQSIYQWRGGDIERILHFTSDFTGAIVFNLTKNRRSRPGIVNFANIISSQMGLKSGYKIENMTISDERKDEKISVIGDVYSPNHEEAVTSLIRKLHSEGVNYSDIAVLMRSVISNGDSIMKKLSEAEIPYYSPNQNKGTIFVGDFMLSIIELMGIMSMPQPQNKDEEEERMAKVSRLLGRIKNYTKLDVQSVHIAIGEWHKLLSKPNKFNKKLNTLTFENEQYNFRKQLFEFCEKIQFSISEQEHELQEGFAACTQVMKAIEEVYRRRFNKHSNYREDPLQVFTRNLKWHLLEELERWTEVGMGLYKGQGVTISTIHAAKGLEWPVVIVPFLWKSKFPLRQSYYDTSIEGNFRIKYGTTFNDEQRLWYVAITRARDRLYYFAGPNDQYKTSPFIDVNKRMEDGVGYTRLNKEMDKIRASDVIHHTSKLYFTVGVSNFLLLLECPYHFYLRYVMGTDVPVGKELGAGDIIHKVISRLKREGPSKINEVVEEEVYLPLGEIQDEIIMTNSIKKKANGLIQKGLLKEIDETEYPFTLLIDNLVIMGILDASNVTKNGIEIIDWKSNVHKEFVERYKNQILVYSKGIMELGHNVSRGIIYDLSDPKLKPFILDINKKEIDSAFVSAQKLINDIMKNNVQATPNPVSCSICDVSEICPKYYFRGKKK